MNTVNALAVGFALPFDAGRLDANEALGSLTMLIDDGMEAVLREPRLLTKVLERFVAL